MNDWLRPGNNGLTLTLHIQPGARRTEIAGTHGDALKIRLNAPPVDGKANAALIDFLARRLKLPKSCIALKSGQTSRHKVLSITGITLEAAWALIAPQAEIPPGLNKH